MTLQLSEQQQAVIDWALNGQGSLNLVARAGCGKTFTLRRLVKAIAQARPNDEMFLGAYNKAIATEIQDHLKADFRKAGLTFDWRKVNASTMHSAGLSAWKRNMNNFDFKTSINAYKVADIIASMSKDYDPKTRTETVTDPVLNEISGAVAQAVSYAKQRAFGFLVAVDDRRAWYDLVDHFGIDDLPEETPVDVVIEYAVKVYKTSLSMDRDIIDFDDMILAPLVHNARIWPKDWVMIDEAQDTNPARRALALAMLKPRTGRLIAVGDPYQAIYGFTGADADSMTQLGRQLGSAELPLNQTYRCPKAVVSFAQQWVNDIEAMPSAPEGMVRSIMANEFKANEKLDGDGAVLCRFNKPLVSLAFDLIRDGIPCKVEGRDIGEGLKKLATRWKTRSTAELLNRLDAYREREVQKWQAKGREEKAAAVEDQVDTLKVIIDRVNDKGSKSIDVVVSEIDRMFEDNVKGVLTLASIHKSKGREWPRVYWLDRANTCPCPWARKDWQVEQEYNLMYVAATRAQEELIDLVLGEAA